MKIAVETDTYIPYARQHRREAVQTPAVAASNSALSWLLERLGLSQTREPASPWITTQGSEVTPPRSLQPLFELPCTRDVREITPDLLPACLARLRHNLEGWELPQGSDLGDAELARWKSRSNTVADMVGRNSTADAFWRADRVSALCVGDEPVGMVSMLRKSRRTVIEMFAIHTGLRGAGWLLVEDALNTSQAWGTQGRLMLKPTVGSESSYEALGFELDAWTGDMLLDPAKSRLWKMEDGYWRWAGA